MQTSNEIKPAKKTNIFTRNIWLTTVFFSTVGLVVLGIIIFLVFTPAGHWEQENGSWFKWIILIIYLIVIEVPFLIILFVNHRQRKKGVLPIDEVTGQISKQNITEVKDR